MATYETLRFKCKTCAHWTPAGYKILEKWARPRPRLKWRESYRDEVVTHNLELAPLILRFLKCSKCGSKSAAFFIVELDDESEENLARAEEDFQLSLAYMRGEPPPVSDESRLTEFDCSDEEWVAKYGRTPYGFK